MIRHRLAVVALVAAVLATSCSHKSASTPAPMPTAFGAAIVESSGGKQIAQAGTALPQSTHTVCGTHNNNVLFASQVSSIFESEMA